MTQDKFEAWLRTVCFQKPTPEAYDLAKSAWIEATKQHDAGNPVAIYKGTVDCGEHGAFDLELLTMIPRGAKLYTRPQQASAKPSADSPEAVQWRNIRHVVRTLADWGFGDKEDPTWGVAWLVMVNGLTAKDGPTFTLEKLPSSTSVEGNS